MLNVSSLSSSVFWLALWCK